MRIVELLTTVVVLQVSRLPQVLRARLFLSNLSSIPTWEGQGPVPTSLARPLPLATTSHPWSPSSPLLTTTPLPRRPISPRRSRSKICPRRLQQWLPDLVVVAVVVTSTSLTFLQCPATLLWVAILLRCNILLPYTVLLTKTMIQGAGDDDDIDFDDLTKRFEALKKKK